MKSDSRVSNRGPWSRTFSSICTFCVVALIRCYQAILRPHLIGCCAYYPTCSQFTLEAFQVHGLRKGLVLAIRRLARCHPWTVGGIDPVPPKIRPHAPSD